jgi:PDZ domain
MSVNIPAGPIPAAARATLYHGFAAALVSSACLAQAALPQVGCAKWQHVSALIVAGTVEEGGLNGSFTLRLDPRDGRHSTRRDFGVFAESAGFDGSVGWSGDRSGGAHELNAAAARAISATESWILRRGWCDPAHPLALEAMPEESDAGTALSVWRVTPPDGIPAIVRFDRGTGLLRQAEYRLWGNRLIRHYDDWRDVGRGITFPFIERDEDPEGEDTETITVSSVKLGPRPFAAAAFARPARPRDYTILGAARSTTVPYEDDGGARIYVPVLINGKGPYAFEVDTGGHLIIDTQLAGALGLRPVGQFANTGAGTAITQTGVVATEEIRIGAAVMQRQVAKVRPFPNDRTTGKPPRAGLLGLELFERFAVRIDRAKKEVELTPLERFTGGGGTALPIRFIEDAPLTRGAYDGVPGDFEIDSGNAGPTIIEGYWAQAHGLDAALARGVPWAAGAGASGYREWLSRGDLELGPLKLPHQIVSFVGQPVRGAESTQLQAGLAGEWALHCFNTTYDYAHSVVWVSARQECPEPPFNHAGLRVSKEGDALVATTVVPGTPAAAAGINAGDRIVSIGGQQASGLSARDAAVLLAGPLDSELDLVIAAKGGEAATNVRLRLTELVP